MGKHDIDDPQLERQLERLLEGLRVALPGVQILFAFLLTVPFAGRFTEVTTIERRTYFVTLICTFFSSACLIAPVAYHRLRFREHDDPEVMIRNANRFAIAGIAWLALALTAAMFFITHFIFGPTAAWVVMSLALLTLFGLWFVVPLRRFLG